jgi:AcrR family transcriptional regulator
MRPAVDHRPAILKTAAHLFAEKAFHKVLMGDVAARAGIAKGTIYRFYPDKESLFVAICLDWMDTLLKELRRAVASCRDGRSRLAEVIQRMLEHHRARRDFFRVSQRAEGFAALLKSPGFHRHRAAIRQLIAGIIRDGQARGEFRRIDAGIAANALSGMLKGFMHFDQRRRSTAALTRELLDLFSHGVSQGRGGSRKDPR